MARPDVAREAACDAGPLIHLDELGAIDLLADFRALLVPPAVRAEVARHRPEALQREPLLSALTPRPTDGDEAFDTLARLLTFGAGEREAILAARSRAGAILLTDDAAARLAAEALGLEVRGSVGVVVRAVRWGRRTPSEVIALLEAIPERSTLHLRRALLDEVLRRVREEWGRPAAGAP